MTHSPFTIESSEIAVDFDIYDPALSESVYDRYREMREQHPLSHSEAYGGYWIATRYEDIQYIVRNPEIFSSGCVNILPPPGPDGPLIPADSGPLIPVEIDPPDHTLYRQILTPVFSPKRMQDLEPEIERIAIDLVDALGGATKVDFVSEFAQPLPTRVILALMGWPQEDTPLFRKWTDTILVGLPGVSPIESTKARIGAALEARSYFEEMIRRRRQSPEVDDVSGILMKSKFGDRALTEREITRMMFFLMLGGLETVYTQLSHSILFFAQNPRYRHQLVADPSIIPSAVEEMIRWESSVAPARVVKEDVVLGNTQLRAGDRVLIPFGAANRDPNQFEDPETVDLTRNPNPHLGFGAGAHRCLGSHLARIELNIALEQWHRRYPDYSLDPEDPPARHLTQVKGVDRLPLILGSAA